MYNHIGDDMNLKETRELNQYTQQDMANFLKISKSYYNQIENNQRNLSYNMAFKIAKIFKLKPDDLFYNFFEEKNKILK